ncbi:hypothetical protein V2W45_1346519 [Cenococcum geophilum]
MLDMVNTFSPDRSQIARNHAPSSEFSVALLLNLQSLEATDPRDKIYGLLGILPQNIDPAIQPDYTKPIDALFREVAKALLLKDENLRVLHCAAERSPIPSTLPSWYQQSTAIQFTRLVRFTDNDRILYCKGYTIDYVENIYHGVSPFVSKEGLEVLYENILKGPPAGGVSALQAFFRAISLDTYGHGLYRSQLIADTDEYYWQAARFLKLLAQQLSHNWELPSTISMDEFLIFTFFGDEEITLAAVELLLLVEDPGLDLGVYHTHLITMMSGRVPFRSANGRMGLGSYRQLYYTRNVQRLPRFRDRAGPHFR